MYLTIGLDIGSLLTNLYNANITEFSNRIQSSQGLFLCECKRLCLINKDNISIFPCNLLQCCKISVDKVCIS